MARSLYEMFLNARDSVVGEPPAISDYSILTKRIEQMAVDLTALIEQVNRVSDIQTKAMDTISTLFNEVQTISTTLASKTLEAENTVDINIINELVSKLKTSTDNLSTAIDSNKPEAAPVAPDKAG